MYALIIFCGIFIGFSANANQHTVGEISIHYNALNTANLTPEVAAQYKLTRSKTTGLVNISVLKSDVAVVANIFGHATNLLGQLKPLAFKEVKEGDAIYYLATFPFSNAEQLHFDLQVQPEKHGILLPIQFKQQLYIE